jgi:hypothetical protein
LNFVILIVVQEARSVQNGMYIKPRKNTQIFQAIISFSLRPSGTVASLNEQACLQEEQLVSLTGEAKVVEVVSTPGLMGEVVVGLHPQKNSVDAYRPNWHPVDPSRKEAEEGVRWGSLG